MFFQKDYATPGPGIDPDAPEKTGLARFAEILQLECVTLVKLNLLFVLSCVPLVTIPPAVFAMNQVVRRMVLDQPVDCFYHYRTAFRRYWKRAYAAFFLTALPLGCAGFGAGFYLQRAAGNFLLFAPCMLCSTVFLLALLASTYLYGQAPERIPAPCPDAGGSQAPEGCPGGAVLLWDSAGGRAGISHQRRLSAADRLLRPLPAGELLPADCPENLY